MTARTRSPAETAGKAPTSSIGPRASRGGRLGSSVGGLMPFCDMEDLNLALRWIPVNIPLQDPPDGAPFFPNNSHVLPESRQLGDASDLQTKTMQAPKTAASS